MNPINSSILADEWKWSRITPQKVRKRGGVYIDIYPEFIHYQEGKRGRKISIDSDGSLPLLKLVVLTYFEDELQRELERRT